jgi:hypothetical protein
MAYHVSYRPDHSDLLPHIIRYRTLYLRGSTYIAITGGEGEKVGTGKTAVAVKIGEMCDPRFTAEDVTYNERDFLARLEAVDRSRAHGRVIILDESEAVVDAKRYMSRLNQMIRYTLATSRVFRPILIFITPMFSDIDASVRKMMNFWIVPSKFIKAGKLRFNARVYELNTTLLDGELRLRNILFQDRSIKGNARMCRANSFVLEPPSDEIWNKVDAKATEFKRQLRKQLIEELELEEKEKNPEPEKPVSLEMLVDEVLKSGTVREFLNRGKSITAGDVRLLVPKVPPKYSGIVAKMASARYKLNAQQRKKADIQTEEIQK